LIVASGIANNTYTFIIDGVLINPTFREGFKTLLELIV